MKTSGMYGEVPAESTEVAISSSWTVSKLSSMLSIGRLSPIMPDSSHLNRSNQRKLDGKPAQVRASERDTVAKLKALIEAELSMPAEKQVLVAGLAQLQDGSVLRELIADGTLDPTTPLRVAVAD